MDFLDKEAEESEDEYETEELAKAKRRAIISSDEEEDEGIAFMLKSLSGTI